jgi:hypothetical protein
MLVKYFSRTSKSFLMLENAPTSYVCRINTLDHDSWGSLGFGSYHIAFLETIENPVLWLSHTQCGSNFTGCEPQSGPDTETRNRNTI